MDCEVPICPPDLGSLFVEHGWAWGDELLAAVLQWLASQDIDDAESMVGVQTSGLPDFGRWPEGIQRWLANLLQVAISHMKCSGRVRMHFGCRHSSRQPPCRPRRKQEPWTRLSIKGPAVHSDGDARVSLYTCRPPLVPKITRLTSEPKVLLDVTNTRPTEALSLLRRAMPSTEAGRDAWIARACACAIMGNCPKSRESFKSGQCAPRALL